MAMAARGIPVVSAAPQALVARLALLKLVEHLDESGKYGTRLSVAALREV
jgi:hypothetical protein